MERVKVAAVRARRYGYAEIYAAVERAIGLTGGLARLVKPGARVFVKINHLSPASPAEKGIVTHPVFVEAALGVLKGAGASVTVGDDIDPVGGDGFQVSGLRQACHRAGVPLVNLKEAGFVKVDCDGRLLKSVYVSKIVREADVIVNLPKFKTHCLTVFTGGVKNMYGVIPHGQRLQLHGEYPNSDDFSRMLTDVFAVIRPQLTVMDGVVAMSGEGPASGRLVGLGIILASADAVALDTVAADIIGLKPSDVYTTRYAAERGLGTGEMDKIEVVGEKLAELRYPGFKLPAATTNVFTRKAPRTLARHFLKQSMLRPQITSDLCTACRECVKACPASAISIDGEVAVVDYRRCIGCLCCNEVCRFEAIVPRRSVVGRLMCWLSDVWKKLMRATH